LAHKPCHGLVIFPFPKAKSPFCEINRKIFVAPERNPVAAESVVESTLIAVTKAFAAVAARRFARRKGAFAIFFEMNLLRLISCYVIVISSKEVFFLLLLRDCGTYKLNRGS
jgi:hypothetical protein